MELVRLVIRSESDGILRNEERDEEDMQIAFPLLSNNDLLLLESLHEMNEWGGRKDREESARLSEWRYMAPPYPVLVMQDVNEQLLNVILPLLIFPFTTDPFCNTCGDEELSVTLMIVRNCAVKCVLFEREKRGYVSVTESKWVCEEEEYGRILMVLRVRNPERREKKETFNTDCVINIVTHSNDTLQLLSTINTVVYSLDVIDSIFFLTGFCFPEIKRVEFCWLNEVVKDSAEWEEVEWDG